MTKRSLIMVLSVILVAIFVSGCFTYVSTGFGIFYRPHRAHPGYCYDCHPHPHWTKVYIDCRYYKFYFTEDGYYYFPKRGAKKVYVFKEYDCKKDKEYRSYYERRWLSEGFIEKEKDREKILQKKLKTR